MTSNSGLCSEAKGSEKKPKLARVAVANRTRLFNFDLSCDYGAKGFAGIDTFKYLVKNSKIHP